MDEAKSSAERVYELLGTYQQGDEERMRSLIHPEAEVHGAPGLINEGTYHGYDGFREWLGQWEEAWDEINYEVQEITDVDEHLVVVSVHTVGIGAGSGVPIDAIFGWLYEWQDGLTTRFHVYPDVESAMEAARKIVAERA